MSSTVRAAKRPEPCRDEGVGKFVSILQPWLPIALALLSAGVAAFALRRLWQGRNPEQRFVRAMHLFERHDYGSAARLLLPLARTGHLRAQTNLGYLYARGWRGQPRDEGEAVRWYRRAADQGYPPAQYNLAHMLADGRGCAPNLPQAAAWYRRAADADFAPAQRSLGRLYEQGVGVAANLETAVAWYCRAGFTFLDDGEPEEARATLAALERAHPTHPLTLKLRTTVQAG